MECSHLGLVKVSQTKHFHSSKHPIITSLEPGEGWSWCYVDEIAMELP